MIDEESVPAEEKPRPRFRLELDHDDVYFGCEALAPEWDSPGPSDVVLDHAPDNTPGQYKWLREENRFHALPKSQQKSAPGTPTIEQAFYAFVKFGPDSPRAKAWLDWFETTFDAKFTGPGA